jgi:hypothetical protein
MTTRRILWAVLWAAILITAGIGFAQAYAHSIALESDLRAQGEIR